MKERKQTYIGHRGFRKVDTGYHIKNVADIRHIPPKEHYFKRFKIVIVILFISIVLLMLILKMVSIMVLIIVEAFIAKLIDTVKFIPFYIRAEFLSDSESD